MKFSIFSAQLQTPLSDYSSAF